MISRYTSVLLLSLITTFCLSPLANASEKLLEVTRFYTKVNDRFHKSIAIYLDLNQSGDIEHPNSENFKVYISLGEEWSSRPAPGETSWENRSQSDLNLKNLKSKHNANIHGPYSFNDFVEFTLSKLSSSEKRAKEFYGEDSRLKRIYNTIYAKVAKDSFAETEYEETIDLFTSALSFVTLEAALHSLDLEKSWTFSCENQDVTLRDTCTKLAKIAEEDYNAIFESLKITIADFKNSHYVE